MKIVVFGKNFGWEIKSIKYLGKVVGGKLQYFFGWEIVKVVVGKWFLGGK